MRTYSKRIQVQIDKAGGYDAWRAEMSRRGKLHKRTDYSTNYLHRLASEDPEKLRAEQSRRAQQKRK